MHGLLPSFKPHMFSFASPARRCACKANVVEGHVERDGVVRQRQAELVVEHVVLYRSRSPRPALQTVSRYAVVGRFLVKLIDSRPDFDHIVLLERAATAALEVPRHGVEENLGELARRAAVVGTVYHDTADLR